MEQLGYDAEGYFVLEILESLFEQNRYIAKCCNCGTEYQNRSPQPCEICHESKGFDITFLDSYWDKN